MFLLIRRGPLEIFWPDRTLQMETPGMIHVFFEGRNLAKDFMERVSLSGVYKKIQMVESSEWSINFKNQPRIDNFGDVSHLCRTVDIPPLPYERTSESEATQRNKRKREVLADDPDWIDGPKRYRKKRRRSCENTKEEERQEEEKDVLARVMSQTKGLQTRVTP